jgi:NADPH-dependent 2,4-dienoyl-CoA reductase/sulfur reductase-like enzyme
MAAVVIVGASVGGYSGRVILVGAEDELPYDKPPLSKQFLAGEWEADRVRLIDADEAKAHQIELRLGASAIALDLAHRRVELANGEAVGYDSLVVATGSSPRPSPWPMTSRSHELRTLGDSRRLRSALDQKSPIVVVGAGFIGSEVAAVMHHQGHHVTIVDPLAAPIGRLLGPEVGARFAEIHRRHGVETRFGIGVAGLREESGGNTQVELSDGETLQAGAVVIGIGVAPNTSWLESSGLAVDDGVLCGSDCRAADTDGVFAVGDVARWYHADHEEHVRVEHWTNAVEQATTVAHNIIHPDTPRDYRPVEYVWSDQYDWKIQIAGRPSVCERFEIIGDADVDPPRFAVVYRTTDGSIGGAASVNWARAMVSARRLLATRSSFEDAVRAVAAL